MLDGREPLPFIVYRLYPCVWQDFHTRVAFHVPIPR
jgi:hypothetical protein